MYSDTFVNKSYHKNRKVLLAKVIIRTVFSRTVLFFTRPGKSTILCSYKLVGYCFCLPGTNAPTIRSFSLMINI